MSVPHGPSEMSRSLVNLIQTLVFVTVGALIGFSLSRFPGDDVVPAWIPTSIGALIGFVACVIVMLVGANETKGGPFGGYTESPRFKLVAKLGLSGLAVAVAGFLTLDLLEYSIGYAMFALGWIFVVLAIVLDRIDRYGHRAENGQERRQ